MKRVETLTLKCFSYGENCFFNFNRTAHAFGNFCAFRRDHHLCHNKKRTSTENKNPASPSNKKISTPQTNKRIRHWIDEKGEIHYSDNIKDMPVSGKKSMTLK